MLKDLNDPARQNQTTHHSDSFEGPEATELRVPALTVLAHPDPSRVGEMVTLPSLPAGQPVDLSRLAPAFAQPGERSKTPLDDSHLSRQALRLLPGPGVDQITLARAGSSTRVEIDGKELGESRTFTSLELDRGPVIVLGHRVALVLHPHHPVPVNPPYFGLIGESTAMVVVRKEIQLVANLPVPVLLRGESGTGKELVAQAIHASSPRADHQLVAVNMAAVPSSLAASELFGSARGAFTGAVHKKDGYFSRAHQGTLFLDEIGETPLDVQPLLLRALENGEVQAVGANAPSQVDVRLISATDADLEGLIASGDFRQPLLHRLAGYEIHIPPLRQRRGDFGRLLFHFLRGELTAVGFNPGQGFEHEGRPWPPADLVGRLARQPWPGNVRQLENAARRLAIARRGGSELGLDLIRSLLEPDTTLPESTLPESTTPSAKPSTEVEPHPAGWRPAYRKPSEIGEDELVEALRENRYELKSTAAALHVSRGSLYNLVQDNPRVTKPSDLTQRQIEQALVETNGDLGAAARRLEVSLHGLKLRMKADPG